VDGPRSRVVNGAVWRDHSSLGPYGELLQHAGALLEALWSIQRQRQSVVLELERSPYSEGQNLLFLEDPLCARVASQKEDHVPLKEDEQRRQKSADESKVPLIRQGKLWLKRQISGATSRKLLVILA